MSVSLIARFSTNQHLKNSVKSVYDIILKRHRGCKRSIKGGGAHIHLFVFQLIVFTVCEHEYMNIYPLPQLSIFCRHCVNIRNWLERRIIGLLLLKNKTPGKRRFVGLNTSPVRF